MQIGFVIYDNNQEVIDFYVNEFEDSFDLNNYLLSLKDSIALDIKHSSNSEDVICLILN